MILLGSSVHESLKMALHDAESSGHVRKWIDAIRGVSKDGLDPFLAIADFGFGNSLFPIERFQSLDNWLLGVDSWQKSITDPRVTAEPGPHALFQLWQQTNQQLTQAIRRGRLNGQLPKYGGILYFCAGLGRCLIFDYDIVAEMPRLHLVAIVNEPQSAFDFWTAIDNVDQTARNSLKAILATGHKIIAHRGILLHVDRRTDTHVFGPSIDTLVMAEILAQDVFERTDWTFQTAMEVGCGNGLLTAQLANHRGAPRELFTVDMSFNAVSCTHRNVIATQRASEKTHADVTYLCGRFSPDLFRRPFDLVVCNPPYIPVPDKMHLSGELAVDYAHAVGGTGLAKQLLESAPRILASHGRMLVMASSLCLNEFLSFVPNHVQIRRPLGDQGFEVLFDVEAVFNRPEWLSYLISERGLLPRDGAYYHRLHPLWLEPQESLF